MNYEISIEIHTIIGVDCVEKSAKIYTVLAGSEREAINKTLDIVYKNLKVNQSFVSLTIISIY
jgi:hypothetical protein